MLERPAIPLILGVTNLAIKKIKIFGKTVFEIETDDTPDGSPDFVSTHQSTVGFVRTAIVPDKLLEEGLTPDDARMG